MSFPLYIFLFAYFLFLLFWAVFSLAGIYHMLRFGFAGFATFFATFAYIVGALVLLAVSYNFLSPIEWGMNVSLFEGIFDANINF